MIQSQPPYDECGSGVGCVLDGEDNRDRHADHYCVADVATNAGGKWRYSISDTTIVDHTVWFYMGKLPAVIYKPKEYVYNSKTKGCSAATILSSLAECEKA